MQPDLSAMDAELAQAQRDTGMQLLMAAPAFFTTLIGWLAIRRQRAALRAPISQASDAPDLENGYQEQAAAELDPVDVAKTDPMMVNLAASRVGSFLPVWARLTQIAGVWCVVVIETGRIIASPVDVIGASNAPDDVLATWADSLRLPE